MPKKPSGKRLSVQCFGFFEVSADGKPLSFNREKTKELFAYLVCAKGKTVSNDELCSVLWEGEEINLSKKSYFRNMISDLQSMLKDAGAQDVLIKQRSALSIVTDKLECDYFSWLQGDPVAINAYRGEFMVQYSWSEFSLSEF